MSRRPPVKHVGQGVGPRRLRGDVLDVAGAAEMIGCSEHVIRARTARGLLPHRRWGGRVIYLAHELSDFLDLLPGVTPAQAIENVSARTGASG